MLSKIRQKINGKAVLVTGCSSGIGRATALYLAKRGFTVFATVRRESDEQGLLALGEPNLVPVCPLDLAKREHIAALGMRIRQELEARRLNGLYAVINNAGGGTMGPIELMDLDKFHQELQTRLLGPVALLQALLPLIRQARGRILWIATPSLMPIPYVSSIHACDFAANCLARTLNLELRPWAIPNVLIRCGCIDTPSPAKEGRELEEAMSRWPAPARELYLEPMRKERDSLGKLDQKRTPPEKVGETVFRALCAGRPKSRYQVGYLSRVAAIMEALPQTLTDKFLAAR